MRRTSRKPGKLQLKAEAVKLLGQLDLAGVVGGMAYVSFPTDEMGECGSCATMYCLPSANPCWTK